MQQFPIRGYCLTGGETLARKNEHGDRRLKFDQLSGFHLSSSPLGQKKLMSSRPVWCLDVVFSCFLVLGLSFLSCWFAHWLSL
ncbi:hypothetical protein Q3G72_003645 [Acer saccharum]|nr:hypothetical protein Q3G72_003645 [Acer saccharum]